jgi:hypothetical protein
LRLDQTLDRGLVDARRGRGNVDAIRLEGIEYCLARQAVGLGDFVHALLRHQIKECRKSGSMLMGRRKARCIARRFTASFAHA